MLDGLRPLGISDAARRIGVDLFEVVRLMVASGEVPEHLQLTPDQVQELKAFGGVDDPWWDEVTLPEDTNPRRARVRAALQCLLDRDHVGEGQLTRMDNLWRGLPDDAQLLLQSAVTVLAEEGHLYIEATQVGLKVAVPTSARATIESIAAGQTETPGLAAVFQE